MRMAKAGVGEVVVKNGEEPALVWTDGVRDIVPAIHVPSPVDTTGAGDSFNGAYLAARLAGIAPVEARTKAHRVAAAVVQVRGALAPFETLRGSVQPLPEPVLRRLAVDLAGPQHRLREIRTVRRIRPHLRLQAEAGASPIAAAAEASCSRATLWPA